MTEYTVDQVTAAYIKLREISAQKAAAFKEEMAPIEKKMSEIENWLLNKMNELGCDQLKNAAGTPYKKIQTSVVMADATAFKAYILQPAVEALKTHLMAMGYMLMPKDSESFATVIDQSIRWDLADLRVGKKGVQEYMEETQAPPPGVTINQFATVNIRRN